MRKLLTVACALVAAQFVFAGTPDLWTAPAEGKSMRIFVAAPVSPAADTDPCSGNWSPEVDMEFPASNKTGVPRVLTAEAVFRGRVSAVIPGLVHGSAASLLELSDISFIKYSPAFSNMRERAYVRHPHARFNVGSQQYCREPHLYAPKIGDLVLVYAFDRPSDRDGTFVFTLARDLVIQPGDGGIHIPNELRPEVGDAPTIDAATDRIRKAFARRRGHAE